LAESGASQFSPLYPDDMPLFEKVNTIVKRIYRGDEAIADKSVRDQLHQWEQQGYGHLPVCMAKTQYSFSTDPNLRGAPTGHTVPVREVRLSAGAGFVVVIRGGGRTRPGLPKAPSSEKIFLNEIGQIEGLFQKFRDRCEIQEGRPMAGLFVFRDAYAALRASARWLDA